MIGNREYKSDVFSMLLEDKENALLLYNALNDSDYTNPDDVEICTLEKGISLTVRNDASFVIDSSLNIYEHQSTVCPNMPLRSLIYVANHLEKRIKQQRLNLFGHTLVKIPTPKFIVFYNGKENQPEKYEYKLSDKNKYLVKVDKWFPSSQICHCCGHRQPMPLKIRVYQCPECGMVCDRDWNAAINIKMEGLRLLSA